MNLISEFRKLQASAELRGITINEIEVPSAVYDSLASDLFSQCVYQAESTINYIKIGQMKIVRKPRIFEGGTSETIYFF